MEATTIDDGVRVNPGDYIAATRIARTNSTVLHVLDTQDTTVEGCLLVKAEQHTFGRRYGHTVRDAKWMLIQRASVVMLSEQLVEQRGAAAYQKFLAYRSRNAR